MVKGGGAMVKGDVDELQILRVIRSILLLLSSYLFLLFLETNIPFFSPSPELLASVVTFTDEGGLSDLRVVLELYVGKREIIVTSPFILVAIQR